MVKKVVVLSGNSFHFVNLLSFAKGSHKSDHCLSLTQDTESSESTNFIEKSDLEFHFCPYGEYHKVECRQCFSSCSLRLVNALKFGKFLKEIVVSLVFQKNENISLISALESKK